MARSRRRAPLRVLHVAAELYPWVKTGGLGDVVAALPPALVAQGVDVRLCLPGFPAFLDAFSTSDAVRLATPFASERVRIAHTYLPGSGVGAYLVDHPAFYDRAGAAPMAGLTGATGPIITAASAYSAGLRRRSVAEPTRTGGPTSCMRTIGMPGSLRPI